MNLNIEIAIPEDINRGLEVIRAWRGLTKKAIITEALTYYVHEVMGDQSVGRPASLRGSTRGIAEAPRGLEGPEGPTEGDLGS